MRKDRGDRPTQPTPTSPLLRDAAPFEPIARGYRATDAEQSIPWAARLLARAVERFVQKNGLRHQAGLHRPPGGFACGYQQTLAPWQASRSPSGED